jgi:pyruvate dehydrogenase E1 component alpha subunit
MTVVRLQQLSASMEDGKVLRWRVADGERVAQGDVIVEVETDKATVEVESPADGTIAILASEGAIVPVDGVLGEVREGDRAPSPAGRVSAPDHAADRASSAAGPVSVPDDAPQSEPLPPAPATRPAATIAPVPVADAVPGPRPDGVDDATLVALYRAMARVRAFEDEVVSAFADGLIPGSTHPCIGQEGIKAGALSALGPEDLVLATYRGHGEALLKGVDPVGIMAELMGRATGVCKGKGGSMHLSEPSVGLVSTNAIVAGHIPMAGGVALSCKFRGTDQVVACFFGDGASCEGEFFETLNMAMLWAVPLVLVCENNGIAISVPTSKSQATPDIADRARGFGMPAEVVDGNDVLAVRAAVTAGVERARAGGGPSFVECKTVRWERHSAFSAGGTDQAAQRLAWQRVDPIPRFGRALVAWGVAGEENLAEIEAEARSEMAKVRGAAEAAPVPGPDSVFDDLYAPGPSG